MTIKAVLFDLDNTLIDFVKMKMMACEAAIAAMRDVGLEISHDKAWKILMDLFKQYGLEYQKIFNVFLKRVMGRVDYKVLSAGIVAYRKVKESFVEPYPHVIPTLIELIKRGYKLGIITDAPRLQAWTRLCGMKLQYFFDVVVTSDDVKARKPHEMPFRVALKKLKLKPEEVLFVGDDPVKDIDGAKKLGIKTVFAKYGFVKKLEKRPKPKYKPDFEINDIQDLVKILPKVLA